VPARAAHHGDALERGVRHGIRDSHVRNPQFAREELAVAVVAIEQLQDRGRAPEFADRIPDRGIIHRVDQPHPPLVGQGVTAAFDAIVDRPGQTEIVSGDRELHGKRIIGASPLPVDGARSGPSGGSNRHDRRQAGCASAAFR
jgi:hypothetical protein